MAIKTLILSLGGAVIIAASASAQSIVVEGLDDAKAFAPGIEIAGGLNAEAWTGTTADRATRLLKDVPADTRHPIVRDMLRRVVLAGLAAPTGADDAFERARIQAAQTLANPDEYARFVARNPAAQDPALRVKAYIARGDLASACEISDAITQGRGESDWVRLRAACHEARGETAVAELARDLLRERGEPTALNVPEPRKGFWVEMIELDAEALEAFMADVAALPDESALSNPNGLLEDGTDPFSEMALIGDAPKEGMSDGEIPDELIDNIEVGVPFSTDQNSDATLGDLESDPEIDIGIDSLSNLESFPDFGSTKSPENDLADLLSDESDQATARLYLRGRDGDAAAVSEFVSRAVDAGLDADRVLTRIPAVLEPADMAATNLPLFARYAVVTRNIAMIQALFDATPDERLRERLALASDAMGNGFVARPLGAGLELALAEALSGSSPDAVRDVLMALALGADLTEPVEAMLVQSALNGTIDANWIGVDHAIDRGAKAESLLRLAEQLASLDPNDSWTIYRSLRRLRDAGFADTAGQLAAYEYLRGL